MKYIELQWEQSNDGVLYFVQRLEEMLFHYSDDIVKAPVHNTATLIKEYVRLSMDKNIKPFHLREVAEELQESLQNDRILKERIGSKKIQKLIDSLKSHQTDTVRYLSNMISSKVYYKWCVSYVLKYVPKATAKDEILHGLRSWIASVIWAGYSSEYVYRYLKETFSKSVNEPVCEAEKFINHFNMEYRYYRVYFLFMGSIASYRELLNQRLEVVFNDDGYFHEMSQPYNGAFVGYIDVNMFDPYSAARGALANINIFISFYRVISNRKKDLISKTVMVRDVDESNTVKMPVILNGYRAIEVEPKVDLKKTIDYIILGCQRKPRDTYYNLKRIIELHNMALKQVDLSDGFVNLWSVLEVVSKGSDKESKIEAVISSIMPVLQNDYIHTYFDSIQSDLKNALPHDSYKELISEISEEGSERFKLMCWTFLCDYEKSREKWFNNLSSYPNIRQKIYRMYKLRNKRTALFNLTEDYARRVKWHLYLLYRVRNGIVHAGTNERNTQVLGEHLHIYCDCVINEIIIKLAREETLQTIQDVLLDTRLLVDVKKEHFNSEGPVTKEDIDFITKSFFKDINDY